MLRLLLTQQGLCNSTWGCRETCGKACVASNSTPANTYARCPIMSAQKIRCEATCAARPIAPPPGQQRVVVFAMARLLRARVPDAGHGEIVGLNRFTFFYAISPLGAVQMNPSYFARAPGVAIDQPWIFPDCNPIEQAGFFVRRKWDAAACTLLLTCRQLDRGYTIK